MLGLAARAGVKRNLTVVEGCTGSPQCAAEVHLEQHSGDKFTWLEIHLSPEDIKTVRRALKIALREWESTHDG